jgi:four helix bundle protein
MSSYRDLIAWQKAMVLAENVYTVTAGFPADERFGLIAQMRRSAVSIASNIAEGHGRLTSRDWQHFLAQARGSAQELETQMTLAARLRIGHTEDLDRLVGESEEVRKIINGLLRSTASRPQRKHLD